MKEIIQQIAETLVYAAILLGALGMLSEALANLTAY